MKKIECDGCGVSEEVPHSGCGSQPTIRHYAVVVERDDGENQSWNWDLCSACHKHLLQGMDPTRRARAKPSPDPDDYSVYGGVKGRN